MKTIFILLSLLSFTAVAQPSTQPGWWSTLQPSDVHLHKLASTTIPAARAMEQALAMADHSFQLDELTTLVNICKEYCNTSNSVTKGLIGLLRENHPVYNGRSPIETNQLRGFVIASLRHFPPQEELFQYVKAELTFSVHPYSIAAAAAAARKFDNHASVLIPLLELYLQNTFIDERVDITTPELNYPIKNPTRVRCEILLTLQAFGSLAYRSLHLIDALAQGSANGFDTTICNLATKTAANIRKTKLPLQGQTTPATSPAISIIPQKDRNVLSLDHVTLMDQEGRTLTFARLKNKPFVLTFFYTQCTNGKKCVATIQRLSELQTACAADNLSENIGIYCMTYDWDFDSPSILKKYGELYGFTFGETARFLKAVNYAGIAIANQLRLRVSYGAGTVSQHGIQLFVFDKKNRIAAICDNDIWNIRDVRSCLQTLKNE